MHNLEPKELANVPADMLAALVGLGEKHTSQQLELAQAVMRGLWAEEKNIGDEETLVQIANSCELDGRMLIKSADTASVQAEYDRNTDDASAASVFGSPWYIVDGEGFWGQDRLDFVKRAFARV